MLSARGRNHLARIKVLNRGVKEKELEIPTKPDNALSQSLR